MENNIDQLLQRVGRLERSNRRLKLIGLSMVAAIVAMGAKAIPHSFDTLNANLVVAKAITVVDENGNLRIAIGADSASSQGGIAVFQPNGIARASLGVGFSNESGMSASDANGAVRVASVQNPDNSTLITTIDPTGYLRGFLFNSPAGDTDIVATDAEGRWRSLLYATTTTGESGLSIYSPGGSPSLNAEAAPNNDRIDLRFYDANWQVRTQIGAFDPPGGEPDAYVAVNALDGTRRAVMSGPDSGGLVQTLLPGGTVSGQLP